jgi:hypothetical protein
VHSTQLLHGALDVCTSAPAEAHLDVGHGGDGRHPPGPYRHVLGGEHTGLQAESGRALDEERMPAARGRPGRPRTAAGT